MTDEKTKYSDEELIKSLPNFTNNFAEVKTQMKKKKPLDYQKLKRYKNEIFNIN